MKRGDLTGKEVNQREDRTNTLAGSFKFLRRTGRRTKSFPVQRYSPALHLAAETV